MTPIFYDHSSKKSIMVWWEDKFIKSTTAPSITSCIKEAGLKQVVFISNNFATYPEARKRCEELGVKLIFGIEFTMLDDCNDRTPESLNKEHRIVVFCKNSAGLEDLLKLYSACHTNPDNKYYIFRFDFKQLDKYWTKNLKMGLPFFDSFIAKNTYNFNANIIPDLSKYEKFFMIEQGAEHPLESIIDASINKFNLSHNWPIEKVKTIYYKTRDEFKAYMTYRCIQKGSEFRPENGVYV